MPKYSNEQKIVYQKFNYLDKCNRNFKKDEAHTFIFTGEKWRARSTSIINVKSANKDLSKAMQTLRRYYGKDLKYIATKEFNWNKEKKIWQYGFHIVVNKPVDLSKINKNNHTGKLIKLTGDIEDFYFYETKSFNVILNPRIGHNLRIFSKSHNVK